VTVNSKAELYNFRLKPGSPAIDRGYERFAAKVDRDGAVRPVNKKFDIGAFEYRSQHTADMNENKNGKRMSIKDFIKSILLPNTNLSYTAIFEYLKPISFLSSLRKTIPL
jgi:hypothetical protein